MERRDLSKLYAKDWGAFLTLQDILDHLSKMLNLSNNTNGTFPLTHPSSAWTTAGNGTSGTVFVLPDDAKIVFYVLQCFFVVFGLVGNVLVILSVRCNIHMKKSISNFFITNLAIADIGVLLVGHTFILGLEIREFHWPFGEFACQVLYPLSDAFYGVSIWSIVAISFHRYRGIVHTMHAQLSKKKARVMLIATWLFSVILITLPLWIFMDLEPLYNAKTCNVRWPNNESSTAYNIYLGTFFYFLPLALILYFYLRIRLSLKRSSGFHRKMTKSSSQSALRDDFAKRIRRNAKALRVLMPVVVVFFITMLPFTVFRLLLAFANMSSFPYTRILFFGSFIAVLANSSANPVIYTIVSPDFRRSFIRFLGMKRCARGGTLSLRQKKWSPNVSEYFTAQSNMLKSTKEDH